MCVCKFDSLIIVITNKYKWIPLAYLKFRAFYQGCAHDIVEDGRGRGGGGSFKDTTKRIRS